MASTSLQASKFAATLLVSAAAIAWLAVPSAKANDTTYNDSITAIFGTGNPAGGWTADVDGTDGITLALRGKGRSSGATTNDGAGDYSFAAGTLAGGYATWNYEFSIYDANLNTDGVTYQLGIDTDPSAAASLTWVNPLTVFGDDQYGTLATASGGGGLTFLTGDTIAQNSENIKFIGLNPNLAGEYTYVLDAYDAGGTLIDQASINVDVSTAPDASSTLVLAALGLGLVLLPTTLRRGRWLGHNA